MQNNNEVKEITINTVKFLLDKLNSKPNDFNQGLILGEINGVIGTLKILGVLNSYQENYINEQAKDALRGNFIKFDDSKFISLELMK